VVANVLIHLELESNPSLDSRAAAAEIFVITSDDTTPAAYPLNFKCIVALHQQDKELLGSAVSNKDYHLIFSGGSKVQKVIWVKLFCLQLCKSKQCKGIAPICVKPKGNCAQDLYHLSKLSERKEVHQKVWTFTRKKQKSHLRKNYV